MPDFLVKLRGEPATTLILEIKGYDVLREVKRQAAERWVAAVNAEGSFGRWTYGIADAVSRIDGILRSAR